MTRISELSSHGVGDAVCILDPMVPGIKYMRRRRHLVENMWGRSESLGKFLVKKETTELKFNTAQSGDPLFYQKVLKTATYKISNLSYFASLPMKLKKKNPKICQNSL